MKYDVLTVQYGGASSAVTRFLAKNFKDLRFAERPGGPHDAQFVVTLESDYPLTSSDLDVMSVRAATFVEGWSVGYQRGRDEVVEEYEQEECFGADQRTAPTGKHTGYCAICPAPTYDDATYCSAHAKKGLAS